MAKKGLTSWPAATKRGRGRGGSCPAGKLSRKAGFWKSSGPFCVIYDMGSKVWGSDLRELHHTLMEQFSTCSLRWLPNDNQQWRAHNDDGDARAVRWRESEQNSAWLALHGHECSDTALLANGNACTPTFRWAEGRSVSAPRRDSAARAHDRLVA